MRIEQLAGLTVRITGGTDGRGGGNGPLVVLFMAMARRETIWWFSATISKSPPGPDSCFRKPLLHSAGI